MTEAEREDEGTRTERRRRDILRAAERVFARKGYHAAGIADIAAELGIGHGTFYRYFENKLDIFRHVLDEAAARIGAVVAEEAPSAAESLADYRAQVERIGTKLLGLLAENEAVARLFFYEALGADPEIAARVGRAWDLFGGYTEAYLRNGKERGFLRADLDVPVAALAINAMIFEGGRRIVGAPDAPETRRRWMRGVVSLMFQGVAG